MIFLFEDKEDDVLSILLRKSFDTDHFPFVYANGNGGLVKKASELLKEKDTIILLLDTVPANKSIRDIYMELRRLSKQNDFRIIVWNIVCAEYYFIQAFGENNQSSAFVSTIDMEIIKEKKSYKESVLLATEEDRAFTKTFEKFCKLYIMKNGGNCINKNKIFFSEDCREDSGRIVTVKEKSEKYKNAYDCFELDDFCVEKAWKIHDKLLIESNRMLEKYNRLGYKKIQMYPSIKG